MKDIIELFLLYINKVKALSVYGWVATYLTVLISPIAPAFLPIIIMTALDIFTGIKASQKEQSRKDVVESKSWKNKIRLLSPFLLGLAACRIVEHSLTGSLDINILGLEIKNVFPVPGGP